VLSAVSRSAPVLLPAVEFVGLVSSRCPRTAVEELLTTTLRVWSSVKPRCSSKSRCHARSMLIKARLDLLNDEASWPVALQASGIVLVEI